MRLRYWFKSAFVLIGCSLGGAVLYTLLMSSMHDFVLDKMLSTALTYMVGFGGVMAMLLNSSAYTQLLPIALSFGSTRKEAMIGMQIYRLLSAVVIAILAGILSVFIAGEVGVPFLLAAALSWFITLVLGTWGSFLGMAHVRYGTKAFVAVLVAGLLTLGSAGAAIIIIAVSDNADAIFESIFNNPLTFWIFVLVPAVLYGVSLIPEKKAIYTYSVKL